MPEHPGDRAAPGSRFAPGTLRERKMRSGTSGLRAVASRATNAGEQRERDRAEQPACAAGAPAVLRPPA